MVAVGPAVVGAAGEAGAVVGAWLFSVSSSSLCMASEILRGYTAVVPWIPRSAADPPVFFSQSALQQPTGKSLDQTLDVATCKLAGRAPKVILGSLNKGVLL